jgi:hypothetical protein
MAPSIHPWPGVILPYQPEPEKAGVFSTVTVGVFSLNIHSFVHSGVSEYGVGGFSMTAAMSAFPGRYRH